LTRTSVKCEIVPITTSGERHADTALSEIGGKNVFVKEIEEALGTGRVDLAVHSSKDLPAVLPDSFTLAAVLAREDARDAMVLPNDNSSASFHTLIERLGATPRIGTSSVRRVAQLTRFVPNARFLPIRGNLGNRLQKLDEGNFDVIVLAAAGLRRLGCENRISALIPVDACVPAPGQGIIAVEIRSEDNDTNHLVERINEPTAAAVLEAERALVKQLGGGCQMPIGAHAVLDEGTLCLTAVVVSPDGTQEVRTITRDTMAEAHRAGIMAANDLLAHGAGEILAAIRHAGNTGAAQK
jgi:hydroxymethylbilane synthase